MGEEQKDNLVFQVEYGMRIWTDTFRAEGGYRVLAIHQSTPSGGEIHSCNLYWGKPLLVKIDPKKSKEKKIDGVFPLWDEEIKEGDLVAILEKSNGSSEYNSRTYETKFEGEKHPYMKVAKIITGISGLEKVL